MFKVEQDSARGKTILTMYGYVGGYIDYRSVAYVLDMVKTSPYKDVDIHIHTYGGSVFDGNMIINFIEGYPGNIEMFVDGIAASMGALITLPAAKVHMAENGFMMLHSPSGSTEGTAKDHIEAAKLLRSIEFTACKRIAKKTKQSVDEVRSAYFDGSDHWLDADECIQMGLADDKFTAIAGSISFTKDEAKTLGPGAILNKYPTLVATQFSKNQNQQEMKQIIAKLKLGENASEEQVIEAIAAIELRATTAEARVAEYETAAANARKGEIKNILDKAVEEQRITAELRPKYEAMFEKDYENTKAIVNAIPKRVTAQEIIEGGKKDETILKMSWDELDKAGRLAELKEKYPDVYKQKHDETFKKKD